MSDARDVAKAAGGVVTSLFGDYVVVFRIAAMILAPMLLAAAIGFGIAAPEQWVEAAIGGLVSLGVLAVLSYWVYRPWRGWGWGGRIGMVVCQLFVLVGALAAAHSTFDKVKTGTCSSFVECVGSSVKQFWDEAGD